MTHSFPVAEEVDETIETVESACYTGSQEGARKCLGWAGMGWPWHCDPVAPVAGSWKAKAAWPDAPRSQAAPTGKREEAPSGLPKLPTTLSVLVDVPAALIKHCGPKQTLGNCSILNAVGVGKNKF